MTSCLHTGIAFIVFYLDVNFKNKIAILFFCNQKCIRCIHHRCSDDHTVLDRKFCFTSTADPASQVLTVKKTYGLRSSLCIREQCMKQKNEKKLSVFHM